jgi:UDP-glucose 4-epimerase|tara:strand:+ start:1031 stop:1924 length:894 start_codon:yes stop_codon:yes gene_type:complete
MKALVTGGSGFIGSHLVDKLIDQGYEVLVIDNESADSERFYRNEKAQYAKQDISNYQLTNTFYAGVDYVFHLAAESKIGPAIENPIAAAQKNVVGTCTVLQCAREWGVKKVIYSSTSSGYGNNPHPNVESQPDDCLNPYSVTKVAGEKLCKMYTDLYDLKTITFRYFNVYGDRAPQRGQYAPVIGIFNRQRTAGEPLTIVGDGEQRRDFIHVSDVVRANILAATMDVDDKSYGKVYNVGTGKNYSVNQIADWISDNQTNIPPRKGEVRESLAYIQRIKNTFGWKPRVDLEQWVKAHD